MKYSIYWLGFVFGLMHQRAKAQDIDSCGRTMVDKDVIYKKCIRRPNDTITLALDIYRPKTISTGKHPAIIFVHGGGFWEGDKRNEVYIKMASAFAVHDYIAFSVNYRLKDRNAPYGKQVLDTCISDVLAAARWIYANSEGLGIDTFRILICGDSAGGGIIVNLCYDPVFKFDFAGCIDLWGGLPGKRLWDAPVFSGPFNDHIPPTCIIHGTRDRIVPYATSSKLANELGTRGIYYELHPLKNADHYPVQLANQFIPLMISFADKTILIRS